MTKTFPLSSIVMCCYNSKQFIHRSVVSILNQTYPAVELIVVDDGSQDGTYEEVLSYKNKFSNRGYALKVYKQQNQGPGYAAINGLKYVSGEYVSFLDSDDALLPTSVEKRVDLLETHPEANIARTNGYRVFDGVKKAKEKLVTSEIDEVSESLFDDIVIGTVNNFAGTFMIRTSSLISFYGNHPVPYSDYGQNLQLVLAGAYHSKQIYINEPLMEYYIYPQSHSHKKDAIENIKMYEGWYGLRKQLVELFAKDCIHLLHPSRIHTIRLIIDAILGNQKQIEDARGLFTKYYDELRKLHGTYAEYRMYNAMMQGSCLLPIYRLFFFLSRLMK